MRILFVLPYGPSETRVRSRMLLTELARRHEITLVALCWNERDHQSLRDWAARGLDVHVIPHGIRSWMPETYRTLRQPLQRIVATSPTLTSEVRNIIDAARVVGRPFDVVHVEHLRGAAASNLLARFGIWTVFDAVDCISELARLTWQRNPDLTKRLVARREEQPTRRLERALTEAADITTVVAERDACVLRELNPGAHIEVVPNGVICQPTPVALVSEPVVIFTGKLSYHANQAAVRWLLDEIWPWVLQAVPDARLVVAGADPPGWLIARSGSTRLTVVSNPPDMNELISQSRVSIAPMPYSVGIQNKVLEAMAAGVPVVATTEARSGLQDDATDVLLDANDARGLAAAVIRLLIDDQLAQRLGRCGYDYARANYAWQTTAERFEALYVSNKVVQWTA